jgi:CheY-like chemotaxis protein
LVILPPSPDKAGFYSGFFPLDMDVQWNASWRMIMDHRPSVLIVGSNDETREVLQTALNRRGVHIYSTNHTLDGSDLTLKHHPDLIVVDLDHDNVNLDNLSPSVLENRQGKNIPIILLGTFRHRKPQIPDSEFVSKPYHYRPLIHRIEELLGQDTRDVVRVA